LGGGYGLFAEEMQKLTSKPPIVIEPGPQLAEICRKKGFKVVEKFLEKVVEQDLPNSSKVFTSFELFEHLHDPTLFLEQLFKLMSSGDLFVFTTLSGTGADIQALWEDSKSVMPPHHLNFFNPHSARLLINNIGFETLQITTPGKLDIDIMVNNQDKIKDRFWKSFIALSNETDRESCQQWLSNQGWSSHMWVVCRKS
jgi:hypothetical protein